MSHKPNIRQLEELGLGLVTRWAREANKAAAAAQPTPSPAPAATRQEAATTAAPAPPSRPSAEAEPVTRAPPPASPAPSTRKPPQADGGQTITPAPPPAPVQAAPKLAAVMSMAQLRERVPACRNCGLCQARTQTVFGRGDETTGGVLFVGEGPGEEEDLQGEPFVGKAGQLLDRMLDSIGLADGKGYYITNIVKCRPPNNRKPTHEEAQACLPYLKRQYKNLQPRLVVSLGLVAAQALTGSKETLGKIRAGNHKLGGVPLLPHYHPAYLLRSPREKRKAWADLVELRRRLAAGRG